MVKPAEMADIVRCPICKREIPAGAEGAQWRPFCSPRCRSVDLGSWLSESYRVAAASQEEEEDPMPTLAEREGDN